MRSRVRANAKKEGPDLRAHLAKKRAHAAAGQRTKPPSTSRQIMDAMSKPSSPAIDAERRGTEEREYWGAPLGKEFW